MWWRRFGAAAALWPAFFDKQGVCQCSCFVQPIHFLFQGRKIIGATNPAASAPGTIRCVSAATVLAWLNNVTRFSSSACSKPAIFATFVQGRFLH